MKLSEVMKYFMIAEMGFFHAMKTANMLTEKDIWAYDNVNVVSDDFLKNLDDYVFYNIGQKTLIDFFAEEEVEQPVTALNRIARVLQNYRYMLNTSYMTMFFEYDPISNYDRTEHHSYSGNNVTGEQNYNFNFGEKINTSVDSGNTTNLTYGKQTQESVENPTSETVNYGKQKNTNVNGSRSQSENNKIYSFDGGLVDNNSSVTADNSVTDTQETDAYTNKTDFAEKKSTITTNEKTDTQSVGKKTVTNTDSAFENTELHGRREDTQGYTNDITVKGNIGVMSSQNMIEQERNIAVFNFAKILCDILLKEVCKCEWECDDFGY